MQQHQHQEDKIALDSGQEAQTFAKHAAAAESSEPAEGVLSVELPDGTASAGTASVGSTEFVEASSDDGACPEEPGDELKAAADSSSSGDRFHLAVEDAGQVPSVRRLGSRDGDAANLQVSTASSPRTSRSPHMNLPIVPEDEEMSFSASASEGLESPHDQLPKMRRKVKLYSSGDLVELYSIAHQRWMLDGEVTEVLGETAHRGGMKIRAGSMKVVYASASRFQWVAPQQIELLRPSRRRRSMRPPAADRRSGELQIMDDEWWISRWNKQYVDVRKGLMRWWDSKELAKSGEEENGSLNLLGLEVQVEGSVLRLKTSSTCDAIFSFSATSEADANAWSDTLSANSVYAAAMRDLMKQSQGVVRAGALR